jgi:MFS family permease
MLSPYRALLARAGARRLALSCGLGWLSFSGYSLAIVLAAHAASGSFAAAGAAVAGFSAGSGLFAPVRGRLVDRAGPTALSYLALAHATAAALLIFACATTHSAALLIGGAAIAGAVVPPLIATARAVWTRIAGPELVTTAHALNAALGDGAQILSPAFVGAVAALVSPTVGLAFLVTGAAVAAALVGSGHRDGSPRTRRVSGHRIGAVLLESSGLRTVVICDLSLGLWLGALEVAVTAVAAGSGSPELASVPFSLSAVGSIAASLWAGSRRSSRQPRARYVAGCVLIAAVLPFALLDPTIPAITVVLVIASAGYGLLSVALFELIDHVVAPDRAVEAFTWLTTWQGVGIAAGAAAAGQLAQSGPSRALALAAIAPLPAAVMAIARRRTLQAGPTGH